MSKRVERAVATFKEGFNCAQSVLSVFAESYGLDRHSALKVATAFWGGMAGMGLTCGAVAGALMAVGLSHGRTDPEDRRPLERANKLVREFRERFRARNGSIICNDLLGCDISTPDGYAKARDSGLFATLCPKLVADAVEILEDILSAGGTA